MPKANEELPPIDEIEADFLAALERLKQGKPENKDLQRLLKDGRLRINISTVAKESGRSRTLLSTIGGKYSRARQKVVNSKAGDWAYEPRTANDTITKLRETVSDLKKKLQASEELNLTYFERMRAAEKKIAKRIPNAANEIAPAKTATGQKGAKVIKLNAASKRPKQ